MDAVAAVIAPVFGIAALGYFLAKCNIFNANTSEGLTRFMFYVAVPAMLFRTLATTELPQNIPWGLLLAFYIPSFIVFALGMIASSVLLGWQRQEQGIAGISSAYSNMVLLGLPLLVAAFGESAVLPLFLLLAPQSLLLFPTTALAIEIYGRRNVGHATESPKRIARLWQSSAKLLVNPIILSLILGIITNLAALSLPDFLNHGLDLVSAAAPACALTALGVGLAQYPLAGDIKTSLIFVSLKNILHPVLVFIGCALFDVAPQWTQVAVLLAAMPCGINAYIFAKNYDLKIDAVTRSIVISTLVSIVTASLLLKVFLNQAA